MSLGKTQKANLLLAVAVMLLVAGVATATAYVTRENIRAEHGQKQAVRKSTAPQQMASAQPQRCDDGNILGAAAGGVQGASSATR